MSRRVLWHLLCVMIPAVCAFTLLLATSAAAQLPAEVRGHIVDAQTGRGIVQARIEIVGSGDHATSQTDGTFMLRGLEPRAYTVRVRAPGYVPQLTDVTVENGRVATLDVSLSPIVMALDTVAVRGQHDTAVAGSVTFDRTAIEASGRRDLGELLRTTPGVVVTQSGGPGSETEVSIRGSNPGEVLVLVDGVPINSSITGVADLSQVALERVERVTVIPGAQSARYGSRALAGVVLVQTRHDEHDLSAVTRTGAWGERDIGGSAGGNRLWGDTRLGGSVNADYHTTTGDFSYTVPAVRGGGTASRSNADMTSSDIFTSGSLDGDAGAIDVRAGYQSVSRGLPGSIVQPSADGRERDTRATAALDGRWQSGLVSWNATADYTHEFSHFADPAPPYGTAYNDSVDANGITLSIGGATSSHLGATTFGVESRLLDITSSMLTPGSPHVQRQLGTWGDFRTTSFSLGSISVSGDATARLDWDTFAQGATISPRAGITFAYHVLSWETSFGEGYSPPALGDQFFHEGVQVRPNPNLRPERVHDDLETRLAVSDVGLGALHLGGEVNAYRSNIDGMILWSPDFQFVWSPNNFDVHRSGWDLTGRAALPSVGLSTDATLSQVNVTYVGAVLSGQVVYRPRTTANFTTRLARQLGTIEVVNRYVGARRTVPGSSLNVLDPYWLTDLQATHPLTHGALALDVSAGLENVFNRSTAMLVDYPFPGRTWTLSLRARRGSGH